MARPTKYDETIVPKSEEYLKQCVDEELEFHSTRGEKSDTYQRHLRVRIPSIEGLAYHLEITRETLYRWEKEYSEFYDIMEKLRQFQALKLMNGASSGDYNATIAKVLLTKHGYREGSDVTTDGKELQGVVVLPKKNEDTLGTTTEARASA